MAGFFLLDEQVSQPTDELQQLSPQFVGQPAKVVKQGFFIAIQGNHRLATGGQRRTGAAPLRENRPGAEPLRILLQQGGEVEKVL